MSRSRVRRPGVPFDRLCISCGLPKPVAEFVFAYPRKWRWDWAWPADGVALEQHGGIWVHGKHSRGAGQLNDFAKWSEGAALGWRIIHVVPDHLESSVTFELIRQALGVWVR